MKKDKIKTWWSEEDINSLELNYLNSIMNCDTQECVDTIYSFAKYMAKEKLTPDNYPIYLKLFSGGNHWIIDALLDNNDPAIFFKVVQPNSYIVSECFKMLEKWKSCDIYPKLFLIIMGILKVTYDNPVEGYKIYPLTPEDINNIGKHLDKNQSQNQPTNRIVLHVLDRLASLADTNFIEGKNISKVADQANNIRGKFLDETKSMDEAIPTNLLIKGASLKNMIKPSLIKHKE